MSMKRILLVTAIILLQTYDLYSQEEDVYSQNTFGGTGLIQTPTARFSPDGEFGFGFSTDTPYNRIHSKVQIFPWMEAVLRYTEGQYKAYFPGSPQTWKDKGIDFKFKLNEETDILPAIAIGLQDLGGTGAYSGEYIVAAKRFNNLDFNIGMGWGRLAGTNQFSNPVGWIDNDRKIRGGYFSRGGKLSIGRLFSGENISVFGGMEYFTPIQNLSLKLEYDTSDYSEVEGIEKRFDDVGDIFEVKSRLNYALNYRLYLGQRDNIDFSLGYVRGDTLYASASVNSNLNFSGSPKIVMGAEKLKRQKWRPFDTQTQKFQKYLIDKIIKELGNSGFVTHNIIFSGNELAAEISQSAFLKTSQAFDLASRVLANNAPKNIETITVINIDQGIETIRSSVDINALRDFVSRGAFPEELMEFDSINSFESADSIIRENEYLYPNFFWEIKPHALGTLQHQERFYFWQLEALIHAAYSFKKGLYLVSDVGINIANNYDTYTYHIPDGQLHHVRQNRRLYLTEGESGLRKLALEYLFKVNNNVSAKLSAGYLEWMYGGVGGEVIYMPDHKRWALGIDAFYVKQREYDQRFSFKDYETFTGFISYYQDIP